MNRQLHTSDWNGEEHARGQRLRKWLRPHRPPLSDRRFWEVQGLVVLIAALHVALEVLTQDDGAPLLASAPHFSLLSFVPVSLFFIPVIYAALNFGFAGSVATAAWCAVLTVPNVALHVGIERVPEVVQIGIVGATAVFVGQRVDRELAARHRAEEAGAALASSEVKYRGLFESSPISILLLNKDGLVLDANPASGVLFGRRPSDLKGHIITSLLGEGAARLFQGPSESRFDPSSGMALRMEGMNGTFVEPVTRWITDLQGEPEVQVLLRDVTDERNRQAGLRAYAARVLRAQEEERKRIAQELHDETIQSLILVCRKLDMVEARGHPWPAAAMEEAAEARSSIEGVVEGIRNFARVLRPPTLDDLGLVTSIRRLTLDVSERSGLIVTFHVIGKEKRLSSDSELGLYRIAQEALRNVERHSKASQAGVTVTFEDPQTCLGITDNGVGFRLPPGTGDFAAKGQLGLLGMQERAQLLGGDLTVKTAPGAGTAVLATVPFS